MIREISFNSEKNPVISGPCCGALVACGGGGAVN